MDIQEYQRFISEFYKKRNWYQYDPFIRSNFLTEEVGEVCRAIRTIEIGVIDRMKQFWRMKRIWKI